MTFQSLFPVEALRALGCAALLWLCQALLFAEDAGGRGGFLLMKNGDGPGVTARYLDDAAFEHVYTKSDLKREDFIPLARLHEYPNVEDVWYTYGEVVNANDFLELAKIRSLRGVTIGCFGVGSEWATVDGDIAKLSAVKQLELLSLNVEPIKDDDLRFLATLPHLKSIEVNAGGSDENFRREGPGLTDACAAHLSKVVNLESLTIHDDTELSDAFVDRLTAGKGKLKWLDLGSPLLTDESVRFLAERCPQLEHLRFRSDRLSDAGVEHLHRLRNLKSLSLESRNISAEALEKVRVSGK